MCWVNDVSRQAAKLCRCLQQSTQQCSRVLMGCVQYCYTRTVQLQYRNQGTPPPVVNLLRALMGCFAPRPLRNAQEGVRSIPPTRQRPRLLLTCALPMTSSRSKACSLLMAGFSPDANSGDFYMPSEQRNSCTVGMPSKCMSAGVATPSAPFMVERFEHEALTLNQNNWETLWTKSEDATNKFL